MESLKISVKCLTLMLLADSWAHAKSGVRLVFKYSLTSEVRTETSACCQVTLSYIWYLVSWCSTHAI